MENKDKRYYNKNKEKKLEYAKKYYKENKEQIKEWKKKYRKEYPEKIREYKKKYAEQHKSGWRKNAVENAPWKAEEIIRNKVLSILGYSDIYSPTKNFYFDALCRKGKIIYAVEVCTSQEKILKKHRKEFIEYFNMPLLLFFVKPDLSKYYLIKSRKISKRTFNYKQGREVLIP